VVPAPLDGGAGVAPLHSGGVSYTLPAHPMDHMDAIGARLTLSATGHGLDAGLISAGVPWQTTHGQWADHHHIVSPAHH
jgi:hypothetical protein